MSDYPYSHAASMAGTELLWLAAALIGLGLDLGPFRHRSLAFRWKVAWLTAFGFGAAILVRLAGMEGALALPEGILVTDPLVRLLKGAVTVLVLWTLSLMARQRLGRSPGEAMAITLFSAIGLGLLVGTENLLMQFAALELSSLCLYVLVAMPGNDPSAAQTGLRYFLFGGVAASVGLFGLSLMYGATGTFSLREMAGLGAGALNSGFFLLGLVLFLALFAFKLALVPMHGWVAEVYGRAPASVAGWIASGSKLAAFAALGKFLLLGMVGHEGALGPAGWSVGWVPLVALLAAVSIILGNLSALHQTELRRLLAFSAVAHAGYGLVGLAGGTSQSLAAVIFYLLTYAFTSLGLFAVVQGVEGDGGRSRISDLKGLWQERPALAICLMMMVLSLAGVPPAVGFVGKFFLFASALAGEGREMGLLWLVLVGVAGSALSFYYYLRVLKGTVQGPWTGGKGDGGVGLPVLGMAALMVLVLGLAPGWLSEPLARCVAEALGPHLVVPLVP